MFYVASRQQSNYASSLINLLSTIDECRRVPRTYVSDGMHRPSHAQVGIYAGKYIKWIAFSFQSVRTALVCENVYNILTVVETFKSSLCFVFVCDEYSFVVSFVLFPLTKLILEIQSYFWRVLNEYLFFFTYFEICILSVDICSAQILPSFFDVFKSLLTTSVLWTCDVGRWL